MASSHGHTTCPLALASCHIQTITKVSAIPEGQQLNMLDLITHPDGFAKAVTNLEEVGPIFLSQLRDEASVRPGLGAKFEALKALVQALLGKDLSALKPGRRNTPVLTTRFSTVFGELAFFSMFTTFGTPQDITLASLRVEHMFAANEATKRVVLKAQGSEELGSGSGRHPDV